ncbi:MAG: hypothetical protein LBN42_03380, partial [Oscillospiraceae bacterium]|nr:hypothetical protein [Oscillospiraceae bacterium]
MNNDKNEIRTSPPAEETKRGINFVLVAMLVAAAWLMRVLYVAMITNHEYYTQKAESLQVSATVIPADRGTIYDADGKVLAASERVWTVTVSPNAINGDGEYAERRYKAEKARYDKATEDGEEYPKPPDPPKDGNGKPVYDTLYNEVDEVAKILSETLDITFDEAKKKCTDNVKLGEVSVQTKVPRLVYEQIEQLKTDRAIGYYAIYNKPDATRYYPENDLAAQVIGFTASNDVGVISGAYGVESFYDAYLSGVNGREERVTSSNGSLLPGSKGSYYAPKQGADVYLTINADMQIALEKHLSEAFITHGAQNRVTGIIMDAQSGAVLAMATIPSFDLNNRNKLTDWYQANYEGEYNIKLAELLEKEKVSTKEQLSEDAVKELQQILGNAQEFQWKNKAIAELYQPGSVFKTVMTAAALEKQAIGLNSTFYCPGYEIVNGVKIKCANTSGHGSLSLPLALQKSCNPAFMQIGFLLGKDNFADIFKAFGFTEKTGIDLPGEVSPYYVPSIDGTSKDRKDNYLDTDFARSSFGQVNTT